MSKQEPTLDELVADLGATVRYGLDRLADVGLSSEVSRSDPALSQALWRRRDELRPHYPRETTAPMLSAIALARVVRSGVDDDLAAMMTDPRRRRWPLLAVIGLVAGAGAFLMWRRRKGDEANPDIDLTTDERVPSAEGPLAS
jgi:hypothetical protein